MSLCFDRLVVYQPAFAKPQGSLQPWVDSGLLELRSPFEKTVDKKTLEARLRDVGSWGLLHQHADMTYLKKVGNEITFFDPQIARTSSDIRGTPSKQSTAADETEFSLQLFLHLAQEFDQHSWELREKLRHVKHQYRALQSSFRQDQEEDSLQSISNEPYRTPEEDLGSFMIEKRLTVWNRLFQKDPANTGLLVTDSRSALAYLLDEVQEKTEVLRFSVTYTRSDTNDMPKDRPSWANCLREILQTVLTTPWSRSLQEEIAEASREIEEKIDHSEKSTSESDDRSISFLWYVVPDQETQMLLNRRCGLESIDGEGMPDKVKNTVVGLIDFVAGFPA
jgi:hypothetical protein